MLPGKSARELRPAVQVYLWTRNLFFFLLFTGVAWAAGDPAPVGRWYTEVEGNAVPGHIVDFKLDGSIAWTSVLLTSQACRIQNDTITYTDRDGVQSVHHVFWHDSSHIRLVTDEPKGDPVTLELTRKTAIKAGGQLLGEWRGDWVSNGFSRAASFFFFPDTAVIVQELGTRTGTWKAAPGGRLVLQLPGQPEVNATLEKGRLILHPRQEGDSAEQLRPF